jgi:hypothetical protein
LLQELGENLDNHIDQARIEFGSQSMPGLMGSKQRGHRCAEGFAYGLKIHIGVDAESSS